MAFPQPQPGQPLSDYVVSLLRTVVPIAWGAAITWLVGLVPVVAQVVDAANLAGWAVPITAFVTAVWYALMRKLEPHLPAWLTAIVLGSNAQPQYGRSVSARTLAAGQLGAQALADAMRAGQAAPIMTAESVRLTKLDSEGKPTGDSQTIHGPVEVRGVSLDRPPAESPQAFTRLNEQDKPFD